VEGVTHKVKRQIDELERVAIADSSALAVDGVPIDSYVTRFQSEKTNSSLILLT
jgi:V-type H+-transporting ATPase subunit C